jgi:hypothetical protein
MPQILGARSRSATARSMDLDRTPRFAIGLHKEWHVEEFFVEMSRWVTEHTVIEEFLSVISYQQYVRLSIDTPIGEELENP